MGARYAVATGLIIAGYSIIDKQGVQHVPPLLYMFCLSTGGGLGMLALIWRSYAPGDFSAEFRAHRKALILGGVLQFTAYGLVLSALQLSPVSYVAPFREIGILVGVVLGFYILKERPDRIRIIGAVLIAIGAALIALAP